MPVPTDADTRREFRLAALLTAALAAGFFAISSVAVAVAMRDDIVGTPSAPSPPAPLDEPPIAATSVSTPTPSEDPNAPLIVQVEMGEFFFSPTRITAPAGRPVRFEVSNPGAVPHEFLVGDRHAQNDAEAEMAKGGAAATSHSHADAASLYLDAGESGVLEATFDSPAELLVGCHVPGHWAAGMKGTLTVTAS